ncbi:MAG: hypothetical protein R3C05_19390 [Pirellulaceae bacterium]
MKTSQQLQVLLNVAATESIAYLCGKFHAHLTLEVASDRLDQCQAFCTERRIKLTIVDLENTSGRSQTDVMLTVHFRDPQSLAVGRITQRLLDITIEAEAAGFPVVRAKLEHESSPSLKAFTPERYHEVHIKLKLPARTFTAVQAID